MPVYLGSIAGMYARRCCTCTWNPSSYPLMCCPSADLPTRHKLDRTLKISLEAYFTRQIFTLQCIKPLGETGKSVHNGYRRKPNTPYDARTSRPLSYQL
jgi:hypothetical protein